MAQKIAQIVKYDSTPNLGETLKIIRSEKFYGLITKLSSDQLKREFINEEISLNQECFSRCPLSFHSSTFHNEIFAIIEVNPLLDSPNDEIRRNYEEKLLCDIQYALHLRSVGPVYIKPSCKASSLGKLLLKALKKTTPINNSSMAVEIDLVSKEYLRRMHLKDECEDDELPDTWSYWNEIHATTNYNPRVEVALVMSSDIPQEESKVITRWLGECVMMVVIPHTCFITNSNNYPVFPKTHQKTLKLFLETFRKHCWIVIEPNNINGTSLGNYRDYIGFLEKFITFNVHMTEQDDFRYPLQPLRDDLDFGTYENFERDTAKYVQYQKAIEAALIDKVPESEKEEKKLVVVVVGAGRGPLVRAALNASAITGRKIKIIIVEKNRNAINTLRALLRDLWIGKEIEIVAKDMRKIQLSEKADILVSELLGSFGDNELSPECLDGAQHLLKEDGISIPCNSISYLRPIMTKRIYSNISKYGFGKASDLPFHYCYEYAILSYMKSVFYIDDPKEAIKFVHPNKEVPIDNTRHIKLEFSASIDSVFHGFSGYFSSQLYKDIEISILPETHTQGMDSWYPIFFPLPETLNIKKGDKIEISFWRKFDAEKVWYEYQLLSPIQSKVVNEGGKVCSMLL